jgi:hypothetical protein
MYILLIYMLYLMYIYIYQNAHTHTEIEFSIANLLALSPLMHLAVAGRKLKLQEERDNYSGPAASHLKTKTALGFEDVS